MELIFIAIVVGIIGYFTNKHKIENPNRSKPGSDPMALFGKTLKTQNEENFKKRVSINAVEKKATTNPVYHDKRLELEIESDSQKIQEEYELLSGKLYNKQAEVKNAEDSIFSLTDKNDLLKGIVLSEVLGPPRAKKPYIRK